MLSPWAQMDHAPACPCLAAGAVGVGPSGVPREEAEGRRRPANVLIIFYTKLGVTLNVD
jgi:hypothetical protein